MRAEWIFLAGVGAGVALGLIFAPKSGREMQEFIAQKAQSGVDKVSAASTKLRAQTGNLADKAKEQVAEAIEAGKQAYREQKAGA
jgi:gas vesicle protein